MEGPVRPQIRRLGRKFGRHDFRRYEDIDSDEASLGTRALHKVVIDCRFLFKESHWGVLTEDEHPGGIIYLDLDFQQPGEYCLKQATVTVTLNDDDQNLTQYYPNPRGNREETKKTPLHISHHGPDGVFGKTKYADKTVKHNATPDLQVGDFGGISNFGRDSEKIFNQEFRWVLSSQKIPSETSSATYKKLTWDLTENYLDQQSMHGNIFHTEFAFQHSGQPFLLQVGISGKLKSRRRDLAREFSSIWDDHFATTLINFNGREKYSKPLDQIAQNLAHAMRRANELNKLNQDTPSTNPIYHDSGSESTLAGDPNVVDGLLKTLEESSEDLEDIISSLESNPMPDRMPASVRQLLAKVPIDDCTAPLKENLANAMIDLSDPDATEDDQTRPPIDDKEQTKENGQAQQAAVLHTPHGKDFQQPAMDTRTKFLRMDQWPTAKQIMQLYEEIRSVQMKMFLPWLLQTVGLWIVIRGVYHEITRMVAA